ncbi:MAG: mannose-1-phosphate guanylyltransferase [Planctomycetaceae bacterium]|nr:mannose-1-phosphate guanylyltransferase [Planctomycetaceae bacterium]
MFHAVIMAGGSGTRFWPASRAMFPKQFLRLGGDRSLIQATVDRIQGLIPHERTQIVTNQQLVGLVREQLPELPLACVLGEPCKRDTAPCIALAAGLAYRQDPDAIQVVMPSDHVIQTDADFQAGLRLAERLVLDRPERIVTFGIRPTYPATAFGYIQQDPSRPVEPSPAANVGNHTPSLPRVVPTAVQQFREKPTLEVAQEFLRSGQYLWNAGIFVWRAKTILDAIRRYAGEIMGPIDKIVAAADSTDFPTVLAEQFPLIQGRSIDYAVMEKYPEVVVVPAPFAWDDVGNWNSLARLVPADTEGNHVVGEHLSLDSTNCVVQSSGNHLVVLAGVSNLVVVQTDDATLIANRDQEELVRKIVPALQSRRQDLV